MLSAHDPVAVAVDEDPVVLDLVQPALLGVTHGVEAEPRVRRDHLQRVLAVELLGVVPFPRGDVLRAHGRPLGIDEAVGLEALEAAGHELDLAGGGLQAFEPHGVGRVRTPVRCVLHAALGEPAHGRRGLVVFGEGHDDVALLLELLPGDDLGQVGGVEVVLDPLVLVLAAHGEDRADAQPLREHGEDVVVGLGFAQRLDALLLQHDHAVVGLGAGVRDVARAVGELADVPALEVGAGRQDDVGEAGLALEPDGLVDDHAHSCPRGTP